ncbi:hypothetical protein TVAG_465460 [Trichomonas vaginalis G3]|uniref:Rab-GAP TBC domain-containing protein n=1 Tax=Trichomonas vaginalis (strain ATCC PRA-98 / G3) TaxID=412133 RepID=A2DU11_TRIV3|nr:GYP1P Ypt/Rab-GAP domain family [Trichomonas vaginalis G3]EAY16158.1 hypothetical protein TVAG_465460 [Trichomonas vaginalis G3]KAI5510408.1 GYP1P Ypt/Rab-GAP domain family [Trichomonas vaginalis G3]|eukprot:XP_001328381.1 hypothetical protein [Trichomonas vaginalis G3]
MLSDEIDKEKLAKCLLKLNTASFGGKLFQNMNDVDAFLKEKGKFKKPQIRILAYYFKTGVLTFDNYQDELLHNLMNYEELKFSRLEEIQKSASYKTILADVLRCKVNYERFVHDSQINDIDINLVMEDLKEVLGLIDVKYPSCKYVQGYDRYTLVLYLLGFQLCKFLEIDKKFIPGLIFDLVYKFIRISDINNALDVERSSLYVLADDLISKINHKTVKNNKIMSIYYALNWRLIFFCDNHNYKDLLLIWDQILLHSSSQSDLENYFAHLIAAHTYQAIQQNELLLGPNLISAIQSWTNFDVIALLKYVDSQVDIDSHQERKIIITEEDIKKIRDDLDRQKKSKNLL